MTFHTHPHLPPRPDADFFMHFLCAMAATGCTWKAPQEVVFFLHIPNAAGTTVRGIFSKECCADASSSKRTWHAANAYSAKPEEIVRNVHSLLARGERRIFAEHHVHLRWDFAPLLNYSISRLCPTAHFRSFTIWREPLALVASNFANWLRNYYSEEEAVGRAGVERGGLGLGLRGVSHSVPNVRVLHSFLAAAPEHLFFGSIGPCDESTLPQTPGLLGASLAEGEEVVWDNGVWEKGPCTPEGTPPALATLRDRLASQPRLPGRWCGWDDEGRRKWAARVVCHAARVWRTVRRRGCASLVREAYERIANLGQVLPLEDDRTIPRIIALAASGSHPRSASDRPDWHKGWMHRQSSRRAPLEDEATLALAREHNPCSVQLDALLRSRLLPSGALPPLRKGEFVNARAARL